ncbi:MAG: hypothetical protein JAZ17_08040 [Candidatus Thiodiazotropha endolucinida]|nr:hypothetical protein [Candidatus Thiodiazotropha taylori]MCG8093564.1 hypothetical protein [Candidatus Thiodiazotropha endolucinida]MCW4225961.1 hypothetical protein [Candidatus Thiodiazotropha endolucinida]MCW4260004.1 hypothetical protein [Candidatus Thiodiazotropha endolucinida]
MFDSNVGDAVSQLRGTVPALFEVRVRKPAVERKTGTILVQGRTTSIKTAHKLCVPGRTDSAEKFLSAPRLYKRIAATVPIMKFKPKLLFNMETLQKWY